MSIDWYYARPELARGYLVEFERRGARALSMMAERGSGKTAFLQQDLGPIAAAHNRMPIYLDVWAVRNDPAVGIANQLKSAAQQLEHKDPRKRELTSVNISVLGVGGGMTAAHRPEPGEPTNELARINFWCDRLANIAGDKKVMLMLDEVQELATHPEGVDVASALRASFQRNYGKFEPVFTGSERDKLLQMFKTSKAPLFEFGDDVDFPKLDKNFTSFIADRFRKESGIQLDTDQLDGAFEALGRKPGNLITLTRRMLREKNYDLTVGLAKSLARERDEHERALTMAKLGPLDQIVLAVAAHERPVFAKEALAVYAQQLGVESVTPKAVQGALARLREEQLIFSPDRGQYRVNNSALAEQLRESTPQLATEPPAARPALPPAPDLANRPAIDVPPPAAKGADLTPKPAQPGKTYVGHILEVSKKEVVQNVGGQFIKHELGSFMSGKYELLKPGKQVQIAYTGGLWKVSDPNQQQQHRGRGR